MGCGSSSEKPAEQPQPAPAAAQPQQQQQQAAQPAAPVGHFQIELQGQWKDYEQEEDMILKRGYMSGFPNAKFHLRGQNYEYDFKSMKQINTGTKKERKIRPPMRMKPPPKPIVPEGPTMVIKVRNGQAGKKIQVPHPKDKSINITVVVPQKAKVGQELLIPIPPLPAGGAAGGGVAPAAGQKGGAGWSTGAKTAVGATAVGAAALVVGGAILYTDEGAREAALGAAGAVGDAAAPHVEAVGAMAAPAAADAGEWAAGAAGDVGTWAEGAAADVAEWAPEAAEDAGDWIVSAGDDGTAFIMDLFG